MQERTLSLTEAQQTFINLPEQFSADCSEIIITRNDQPVLTIMPYKTHQEMRKNVESLQTILEIMLGGEAGQTGSQKTEQYTGNEQPTSWEKFQKEVGWE